jgi:hypothetical protein
MVTVESGACCYRPQPSASSASKLASATFGRGGRSDLFCFSTGGEALVGGGAVGLQQGKLCLSVDGKVWSKVLPCLSLPVPLNLQRRRLRARELGCAFRLLNSIMLILDVDTGSH